MTYSVRIGRKTVFRCDAYWEVMAFVLGHWTETCHVYKGRNWDCTYHAEPLRT
jgi:hypothetical protein